MICSFRWRAPRHDVPESVPVEHVCWLDRSERLVHICACGAIYIHQVDE